MIRWYFNPSAIESFKMLYVLKVILDIKYRSSRFYCIFIESWGKFLTEWKSTRKDLTIDIFCITGRMVWTLVRTRSWLFSASGCHCSVAACLVRLRITTAPLVWSSSSTACMRCLKETSASPARGTSGCLMIWNCYGESSLPAWGCLWNYIRYAELFC